MRSPWEARAAAVDQPQYREERYQARRDELRATERLPEAFLPEGQWGTWLHGMRQAATAERAGTYGDNVSLQAGRRNIRCALASGVVGPTGHRRLRCAASRGPRGQVAAVPPAALPQARAQTLSRYARLTMPGSSGAVRARRVLGLRQQRRWASKEVIK